LKFEVWVAIKRLALFYYIMTTIFQTLVYLILNLALSDLILGLKVSKEALKQ